MSNLSNTKVEAALKEVKGALQKSLDGFIGNMDNAQTRDRVKYTVENHLRLLWSDPRLLDQLKNITVNFDDEFRVPTPEILREDLCSFPFDE